MLTDYTKKRITSTIHFQLVMFNKWNMILTYVSVYKNIIWDKEQWDDVQDSTVFVFVCCVVHMVLFYRACMCYTSYETLTFMRMLSFTIKLSNFNTNFCFQVV